MSTTNGLQFVSMPILKKYDNFEAMKRDEARSVDSAQQEILYEEFEVFVKFLQAHSVKDETSERKDESSSHK